LSLRTNLFGAACALALVSFSAPAFADFSGVLSGDYGNVDFNHGGGSVDDYGVSGGGMFGLAPNWAAQIDGGYHHLSGSGSDANEWNAGGAAFWRANAGRIGAVIGYNDVTGGGANANATNYGLFGDWYAGRSITVGAKGGYFNASHGEDGEYAGVAVTGYVMPDFSLSGYYDYSHFKGFTTENDYTAEGEWLISERTPFSIYGGYTRSDFSGTGGVAANTWFVGIRFYCDPVQGATLVDRQRNGAEIYGTTFGPAALHL
jgi:hypothetical protein